MEKETIKIGQLEISFSLTSADTNGSIAVFDVLVPVGAKVPLPHYHENYDETIYGLEGITTFKVSGETIAVGKGQTLFIPRGAPHGFNNLEQTDAKFLAMVTPALVGPEYFREVAEIVNAGGPPDIEKIKSVFKKYGLVPVLEL